MNENHPNEFRMALWQAFQAKGGLKGRSGPPGNINAFKHEQFSDITLGEARELLSSHSEVIFVELG